MTKLEQDPRHTQVSVRRIPVELRRFSSQETLAENLFNAVTSAYGERERFLTNPRLFGVSKERYKIGGESDEWREEGDEVFKERLLRIFYNSQHPMVRSVMRLEDEMMRLIGADPNSARSALEVAEKRGNVDRDMGYENDLKGGDLITAEVVMRRLVLRGKSEGRELSCSLKIDRNDLDRSKRRVCIETDLGVSLQFPQTTDNSRSWRQPEFIVDANSRRFDETVVAKRNELAMARMVNILQPQQIIQKVRKEDPACSFSQIAFKPEIKWDSRLDPYAIGVHSFEELGLLLEELNREKVVYEFDERVDENCPEKTYLLLKYVGDGGVGYTLVFDMVKDSDGVMPVRVSFSDSEMETRRVENEKKANTFVNETIVKLVQSGKPVDFTQMTSELRQQLIDNYGEAVAQRCMSRLFEPWNELRELVFSYDGTTEIWKVGGFVVEGSVEKLLLGIHPGEYGSGFRFWWKVVNITEIPTSSNDYGISFVAKKVNDK